METKTAGLLIGNEVEHTPHIDQGIKELDAAYTKRGIFGFVSSGFRSPEHQLRVIRGLALKAHIDHEFPYFNTMTLESKTTFEGKEVFEWQVVWSRLMNLMYDVNPPEKAELLMSRIKGGTDKKGKVYPQTQHADGISFDVEGHFQGQERLDQYTAALEEAMAGGEVPSIASYTKEPPTGNNCLHCNCKLIDPPQPVPPVQEA